MAVVNPVLSPTMVFNTPSVKDSRWLTLDVCREFTRNKCSRSDDECRYAHPPSNVEVQNGRVTCCFDSIKGKCQRRDPPCKYLHPPQHLKEQLLQNGRNNLILKHIHMQMLAQQIPAVYPVMYEPANGKSCSMSFGAPLLPGQEPYMTPQYVVHNGTTFNPYYTSPYTTIHGVLPPVDITTTTMAPMVDGGQLVPVGAASSNNQQNGIRSDRIELQVSSGASVTSTASFIATGNSGCPTVNTNQCPSPWNASCSSSPPLQPSSGVDTTAPPGSGATFCSPVYFQGGVPTGMMPLLKRNVMTDYGKCGTGVPMYQGPTTAAALTYHQMALMQLQQPTYVPVAMAGHPQMFQRY